MTHQEHLDAVLAYHARHNRNAETFRKWLQPTAQEKLELHVFEITRSLHDMALQIFRYPS